MNTSRFLRAIVAQLPTTHGPPPCLNLGRLFRLGQQLNAGQAGKAELLLYAQKELQTNFVYALQVLNDTPSFQPITQSLLQSLASLEKLDSSTTCSLKLLRELRKEQRSTLQSFAAQMGAVSAASPSEEDWKQDLTSKFYRANLGSHTLLEELCALLESGKGLVQYLSVESLVNNALGHTVKHGVRRFGGANLSVALAGNLEKTLTEEKSPLLLHIKPQLQNIVRSLIGQAVYDTLNNKENHANPTIRINVIHGEEDVCIKISDTSGGRSLNSIDDLWKWKWPAQREVNDCPFANNHGMVALKIVAKYFGGDLDVVPMEGYGNDTYLYLKRNTTEDSSVVWDEAWEEAEREWKKWRISSNKSPSLYY